MIHSIVLLPFVALVLNDAQAERVENNFSVTLTTSEPVSVDRVKGMTGPQRMYVFLNDTTTSKKSFPSVHGPIVAHARTRYTKLEIPTGPGGRCLEPVTVEATANGARLRARCNESAEPFVPAYVIGLAGVARTNINADTKSPPRSKAEETQLRQALVPPDNAGVSEEGKRNERKVDQALRVNEKTRIEATSSADLTVPHAAPSSKAPQSLSDKDTVSVPAVMPPGRVTASQSGVLTTSAASTEGGFSMILAVLVLAGLGIIAFLLARRRTANGRIIHILETASIGAKRSLVVAKISGRTMVLGVSEAGVTLLDSTCDPVKETDHAEINERDATFVDDELPLGRLAALRAKLVSAITGRKGTPAEDFMDNEVEALEPENKSEGGVLERLFSRHQEEKDEPETRFQDVLDDSYEDQQLRQKLASGMGGRVA